MLSLQVTRRASIATRHLTSHNKYFFIRSSSTLLSENTGSESSTKKDINKSDLVLIIAEEHELTKAKAERVLNTVLDTIVEAASNDQQVNLSGFGSFSSVRAAARLGRNPITGEAIQIPEKRRPKFAAFKAFKDSVNDK